MRFNLRHMLPLALLATGCGTETTCPGVTGMDVRMGQQAQPMSALMLPYLTCAVGSDEARVVGDITREQVKDDIYHYSLKLQVGPDAAHDVVVLHRVVRERTAWQPVASAQSLFLVHGDAWNFQGAFLASTLTQAVPTEQSVAVYLAQRGVDVWGIDQRWTQVPLETTDFSFMKDWNLGTHAKDVGTGLATARRIRSLTGSGNGQMKLLGWSRGAQVAYAYLNAETRQPAAQRHVNGFIPVDMVLHFGPEGEAPRQAACVRAQAGNAILSQGRYEGNLAGPGAGLAIIAVGQGAVNAPTTNAPAPLPPLPFGQLGVALGASTYAFISNPAAGIEAPVPFYHFTAGQFAGSTLTGLKYTNPRQFFDFLSTAQPYQDLRQQVEGDELLCGTKKLPYDDSLKEVKVPVLYVGAGGGFGRYGEFSATKQLGAKDISVQRVQFLPEADRAADFGHADLWLGNNAAANVWEPIFKWLQKH